MFRHAGLKTLCWCQDRTQPLFEPMLCCDGAHWSDFVLDALELPLTLGVFHLPGKSGSVILNEVFSNVAVFALRLKFKVQCSGLRPGGGHKYGWLACLSTREYGWLATRELT